MSKSVSVSNGLASVGDVLYNKVFKHRSPLKITAIGRDKILAIEINSGREIVKFERSLSNFSTMPPENNVQLKKELVELKRRVDYINNMLHYRS